MTLIRASFSIAVGRHFQASSWVQAIDDSGGSISRKSSATLSGSSAPVQASRSLEGSSVYTITGTARVTDSAQPSQTSDMPFTIEAPC